MGGPARTLEGTERERNLVGIGKAEGAGEAWKVGPAYAAWILAGVADGLIGIASESEGENTRSMEGWDCVCVFMLRGPEGICAASPERVAPSPTASSAGYLLGDAPAPLKLLYARFPRGFRCDCLPALPFC